MLGPIDFQHPLDAQAAQVGGLQQHLYNRADGSWGHREVMFIPCGPEKLTELVSARLPTYL